MYRRSTRNSAKPTTETKVEKKRATRQSKRRKRSVSKCSESEDENVIKQNESTETSNLNDSKESAEADESKENNLKPSDQTNDKCETEPTETNDNENIVKDNENEGHIEVKETPIIEEEDKKEEKGKSKGKIKSKIEVESDIKMNSDISDKPEQTSPIKNDTVDNDLDVNGKEETALPQENKTDDKVLSDNSENVIESEKSDNFNETKSATDDLGSVDKTDVESSTAEVSSEKDIEELKNKSSEKDDDNLKIDNSEKDLKNDTRDKDCSSENDKDAVTEKNDMQDKDYSSENDKNSVTEKNNSCEKIEEATNEPETEEGEICEPEEEKKTVIIKLRRNSLLDAIQNMENETEHKPKKRIKWNVSFDFPDNLTKLQISDFQNACPDLKIAEADDVKLEETLRRYSSLSESETKPESKTIEGPEAIEKIDYNKQISEDDSEMTNVIALNRKISIVDDPAKDEVRRPPSPAKNPVSNVLYITNLVRPFTIKQLKELLERTGKITDNGFWTDKIKSKCFVEYETADEAEATRGALHGIHWPVGNGKKLVIEYSNMDEMENARNPPPPVPVVAEPAPEVVVPTREKSPLKENREPVHERRHEEPAASHRERGEKKKTREWDLGKQKRSRSRSHSRGKRRRHSDRRSPTPMEDFISRKQKKLEESVPQKMMDDLFQKTKATPSIYWQPLSPEEIATKQRQRQMRMEEHKRRLQENSRNRVRSPGRGAYRRR